MKKRIFTTDIQKQLEDAGYDHAIAVATEAEIDAGAACGQLSIIIDNQKTLRKSRGVTLVEILILVAISCVLGFGVLALLGGTGCNRGEGIRQEAKAGAEAWAQSMGLTPVAINCVPQDSDGDGYVACTISTKNKAGDIQIHSVECAAGWTWNEGCRLPKATVRK